MSFPFYAVARHDGGWCKGCLGEVDGRWPCLLPRCELDVGAGPLFGKLPEW